MRFRYEIEIEADTKEQADRVIAERIYHDEDYGFDYTLKIAPTPRERLEQLRAALRAESISYGELAELESLADHIEPGDVELAEAAGVPEGEVV